MKNDKRKIKRLINEKSLNSMKQRGKPKDGTQFLSLGDTIKKRCRI